MRYLILLLITGFLFNACGTQKRALYNYLEDIKDTTVKKNLFVAETIIQKNDLLSIQVYSSSTEPEKTDVLYNLPVATGAAQNPQLSGYLVDMNGNIEMPRIGVVHAEGLTKNQLSETIKERLKDQLLNPGVIIRFLNFRITVLGEVGAPGVLNIPTERLSILEAIGMAGGVTEFGTIKEVKVLRANDGIVQTGVLDLTSKNIFESPYFQLQQNDVVLVDQTRYKLRQTEQQRISTQIGFATTIITTIALVFTIFNR